MLSIVSAIQNGKITQHLRAERQMLNLIFIIHSNMYFSVISQKLTYKPLVISLNMGLELHLPVKLHAIHEDFLIGHVSKESKEATGPYRSESIF